MKQESRLRIAIQKSGRLSVESEKLFKKCGLKISLNEKKLIAHVENMPIDILRVRDDDIPGLVFDEVVDLGIVGENVLTETKLSRSLTNDAVDYKLLRRLDFGECRLSIAVPADSQFINHTSLENMRIATSYPQLLKQFMLEKKIDYKTCLLNGSVEIATRAELADAICDLVSTGSTLEANGLRELEVMYRFKACLIQTSNKIDPLKQDLIDALLRRIQGVIQARESKYIMLHADKNCLDEVISLLPGLGNPTILPLAHDNTKVALHMVSQENLFWETMEELKAVGASSILVLPIEKIMD